MKTLRLMFAVGVVGLSANNLMAQGQWQRAFYRWGEYLGNPNYINRPQGGPLFDNNIFEQRLQYNRTGEGYTYENYRFFGPDSYGNPNTLDLGPLKVQLGRDPNVVIDPQPLGIHNRLGYTTRLIPEVFFNTETGQRNFNQFSGQTSFTPVPLRYDIILHTGFQDVTYSGNAQIRSEGSLNALGFYQYELQFTNVGENTAEGYLAQVATVTDFDTGPIDISGNILFDGIATLFQADGNSVAAIPPRIASAASAKGHTVDELLADIDAGKTISEEDMHFLVQQMFIAAFQNDPIGFMTNGLPETVPGFEALSLELSAAPADTVDPATAVPEPSLLAMMSIPAVWHLFDLRRRRSTGAA